MTFLNSLDKLRPNGKDKWRARCPVHNGSNATALSIVQWSDGAFGIKCFSCGADGPEVFRALGLPLDELFGDKNKLAYIKPTVSRVQMEQLNEDQIFVAIYDAAKDRGEQIKLTDHKRYRLSINRIEGVKGLMG